MPLAFATPKDVKYWTGSAWSVSQDFGNVKMWDGLAWRAVRVRPYIDVPLVTFSPDGGTSEFPTELSDYQYNTDATVTINASSSVVWTYSGGDGFNGYANIPSGTSSTSITFYAAFTNSYNFQQFNVSASTGVETKYWFISLISDTFA